MARLSVAQAFNLASYPRTARYDARRIYFVKEPLLFPLALGTGAEKHGKSMTNDIFITPFSAKDIPILRTAYRAACIPAGAGEHPALPGQFDYLPEIAPAPKWFYRLDDNRSGL